MAKNISQPNTTESECDVISKYWLYSTIVCSVLSFAGKVLVILTVCLTKTMRTTNYFVLNMSVSDIFVPAMDLLSYFLFFAKYATALPRTISLILCKIIPFVLNTSHGVSMSSLVVITVHRFYGVASPLRARLESGRTRNALLFCTWLMPIAVCFPHIYYYEYVGTMCYQRVEKQNLLIQLIIFLVFFLGLPFLFMFILHPVITFKLVRQKAPRNSSSRSQVKRRREQNVCMTVMFIIIIVTLLLSYGTYQVAFVIHVFSLLSDLCTGFRILIVLSALPNIFHTINPLLYFIFCSSYRQGIKQIFSCCCRQSTVRRNPPGDEHIDPVNVPRH